MYVMVVRDDGSSFDTCLNLLPNLTMGSHPCMNTRTQALHTHIVPLRYFLVLTFMCMVFQIIILDFKCS